jgi:hypothetical protein
MGRDNRRQALVARERVIDRQAPRLQDPLRDDEIIGWLERREQRRRVRASWPQRVTPAGAVFSYALTAAALRHFAGGGSTSGASGVKSGGFPSSTCNLKSAALSIRAAEILGSVVALANLKRIAA